MTLLKKYVFVKEIEGYENLICSNVELYTKWTKTIYSQLTVSSANEKS